MRITGAFVLGAIVGAVVAWRWGEEMEEYVEDTTRGVRRKAQARIRLAERKAGKALDRVGEMLGVS